MEEKAMMENQPETQPKNNQPSGGKVGAAIKEWFRKRVVTLKVRPQIIPLIIMVLTTVYFMLILFSVSAAVQSASTDSHTKATGVCTFITTLLSLLYLVSFLNAFPKRKKPNIIFIVVVCVMMAGQLACDLVYYLQMDACIAGLTDDTSNMYKACTAAQPYVLGHMILLGISAVVFALLPVYARLIKKINTSIKLESATESMNEKIDIEEE